MIKYFFWTLILIISVSCQKKAEVPTMAFVKGDCLERPLGAYTYQVAFLENNSVYAYRLGPMGKKVYKLDKIKDFQKIQCP